MTAGGCNTGILNSWGDTVRLDSVDVAGRAPAPVPPPPPTPCKWRHNGAVVIEQDNGIRVDLDQWHNLTAIGPARLYAPGATVQSNLWRCHRCRRQWERSQFLDCVVRQEQQVCDHERLHGTIDPEWGTLARHHHQQRGCHQRMVGTRTLHLHLTVAATKKALRTNWHPSSSRRYSRTCGR